MKKWVYQLFVYVSLAWTALATAMFIYEMAVHNGFSPWGIAFLVLLVVGIILFVLNQVMYRQFKERDASLYEQKECPFCHTLNSKKEMFCKNCGRSLDHK